MSASYPSACVSTNPWLNHSATIARITQETPGVATYDLVIDDESVSVSFHFAPGQFNMIYLPGVGEVAISISGAASSGPSIIHTIREAGNVTRALAELKEGDSVGLRGPFGSSWPIEQCVGKDIILVAGGIGLAPLRPVVYEVLANREQYGNVSLLIGARTAAGLLYGDELETWNQSIDVQRTVDRSTSEWTGHVGVVTVLLERLPIAKPKNTVLMTCGPEVMMWYSIRTALSRGMTDESVWLSLERNMNCAIGMCGHCQLGPQFVCKDGPVFRYDQVASIMKVAGL
ncbi:MAG: FAD/NAD(P)-binding protein [Fuerstiella sp.]